MPPTGLMLCRYVISRTRGGNPSDIQLIRDLKFVKHKVSVVDSVGYSAIQTNTLHAKNNRERKTRTQDMEIYLVPLQFVGCIHGSDQFHYVLNEERVNSWVHYAPSNINILGRTPKPC